MNYELIQTFSYYSQIIDDLSLLLVFPDFVFNVFSDQLVSHLEASVPQNRDHRNVHHENHDKSNHRTFEIRLDCRHADGPPERNHSIGHAKHCENLQSLYKVHRGFLGSFACRIQLLCFVLVHLLF